MSRFGDRVTKTTVIVSESANAEQNAGSCSISVDLKPFGQLVAQETDPEVYAAIDRAAAASGGYWRYDWEEVGEYPERLQSRMWRDQDGKDSLYTYPTVRRAVDTRRRWHSSRRRSHVVITCDSGERWPET